MLAEDVRPEEDVRSERLDAPAPAGGTRRVTGWTGAVALLLLGAFLLRVWGVHNGLPYAYNADENAHFVPKAIGLFGHGANPHYFVNPPAFTYVLHGVFAVWFGGREGVSAAYATRPADVFVVARVTSAVLGTAAVGLLYLAGTRLFDRRVGLLAGGLLGVAFLPVFYSRLALNDAPTLAPVCLSLWASAGILRFGRQRDYLLGGLALGLAAATKYTGGIVLVPLVGAAAVQWTAPGGRRTASRGLLLAAAGALVGFVLANPYALLSPGEFLDGLAHQNDASTDVAGKLGLTQDNGYLYYAWTATWGLGWIPALASVGAVGLLWRDERRLVWVLAPAPILFLVFMGGQGRFFGRWLLPILPVLCLLAAYFALELADWGSRRRPALRPTLVALVVVALCGQGAVSVLHSGRVLSQEDTRNQTREWMVAHVPPTTRIGHPSRRTANGNRWVKFPTSRSNVALDGSPSSGDGDVVNIEDYERFLRPGLVDLYERQGYCWVVSGSTQRGRAEADAARVPQAIAYYSELARRADLVHVDSPYGEGARAVGFNFDWSFDYYPLAYERPGPVMQVYRLRGGRCAS